MAIVNTAVSNIFFDIFILSLKNVVVHEIENIELGNRGISTRTPYS